MEIFLLAGTPGQSKQAAANKIVKFLHEKHGVNVGTPANVEDMLLDLFPEYDGMGSIQEPRVSLIGERPQDEIKDKWPKAFENAVESATAGNPDVAIVLICFEYYRFETERTSDGKSIHIIDRKTGEYGWIRSTKTDTFSNSAVGYCEKMSQEEYSEQDEKIISYYKEKQSIEQDKFREVQKYKEMPNKF